MSNSKTHYLSYRGTNKRVEYIAHAERDTVVVTHYRGTRPTGTSAILSVEAGRAHYRETLDGGWSKG